MNMLLEGNLRGIPPADLLQWIGSCGADAVLAAGAGEGFRFRFREGRLIGASRANAQQDLQSYLLRSRLSFEQALKVTDAAREQRIPFALAAIRLGYLEDEVREVLHGYLLEVVSDFLRAKEGPFFVASAAQPYLEILAVEAGPTELVLEAAHRLDEEGLGTSWRPAQEAQGWLGGRPSGYREVPAEAVESLLRESARAFEAELMGASRSSAPPAGVLARPARSPSLGPTTQLKLARKPSPDESLFLTELEVGVIASLATKGQSLTELRRQARFAGQSLETVLNELARMGILIPVQRGEILPGRLRWIAAGVAGVLFLLALGSRSDRLRPGASHASVSPAASQLEHLLLDPEPAVAEPPAAAKGPAERTLPAVPRAPARPDRKAVTTAQEADPLREPVAFLPLGSGLAQRRPVDTPPALPPARNAAPPARSPAPPGARPTSRPSEAPLERERPPQPSPEPAPLESAAAAATPEPAELSPTPAEAFALEGAARAPAGMGSVLVNAMPYGFVRIDGKEYGATAVRVALAPGPHLVEVFRKGYRTEARNVAVGADRERVEAFLLDVDGEAQEE